MRKKIFYSFMLLCVLCACSSDDGDQQPPVISDQGITANPIDCQQYHRGDTIPFHYVMTDNEELGAYNIEVHNNFDHHTHAGSSVECPMDPDKDVKHPWVFNKDYKIPAGLKSYDARQDIAVPDTIDTGDYHFMIRVTDQSGWQEYHSVAIKIID